jgi:nitrite reductase/ring-hydroxylating ferredoxin subunit
MYVILMTSHQIQGRCLVEGQSVALFRVGHEKRIYALSNKDPFSQANVMCALLVICKVSGDCITDLQTTF